MRHMVTRALLWQLRASVAIGLDCALGTKTDYLMMTNNQFITHFSP